MGEILFFGFGALAILGALAGQGVLAAAREHVRVKWPAWFDALAGPGGGLRLGGPAERARRRLLRPLLFRNLPDGPAGDEDIQRFSALLRLALGSCAAGCGGMALALWLRSLTGV